MVRVSAVKYNKVSQNPNDRKWQAKNDVIKISDIAAETRRESRAKLGDKIRKKSDAEADAPRDRNDLTLMLTRTSKASADAVDAHVLGELIVDNLA